MNLFLNQDGKQRALIIQQASIFVCLGSLVMIPVQANAQNTTELWSEETNIDLTGIRVEDSDSQPWSESVNIDLEPELTDIFDPVIDFLNNVYEPISPIIDASKQVYAQINEGNLEDAIYTALGAVGLIDPEAEANNVGWTEKTPYYDPQSPEEVIRRGEAADSHQSQVLGTIAQIVFGKNGQQVINDQNIILGQTQQTAASAQAGTTQVHQDSHNVANRNGQLANQIQQQTARANSSRITQDVMKAIAAQNNYAAQIDVGISQQLALIGENQVYNGLQMQGLNTQLTIANQRSQNMETFLASQITQLAEIDANQEQQIRQQIEQSNRERTRNRLGMSRIFIPGLYQQDGSQNNTTTATSEQNSSPESTVANNSLFLGLSDALNQ